MPVILLRLCNRFRNLAIFLARGYTKEIENVGLNVVLEFEKHLNDNLFVGNYFERIIFIVWLL